MRKLFTTVMAALMALSVWAEAPQTISYQAVVRNNVGRLHRDKPVGVRITILSGSEDGQVVYSETRTATTNNNGLLTFAIGDANAESSYDLSKIAWADNTYYLRCEMDPDGGSSYTLSSTSQMNSVPYALYAKNIAPEALPTWAQSEEKPVYNYTEIQGAPSVPTKVSELQNDANYITLQQVPTVVVPTKVSELQNDANYLTEHQSLADYAKKSELPSTAGLLSEADAAATYQPKGEYLTEHQSLADYAKKSELPAVPTKVSQLSNDAGYVTEGNITTVLNTTNVSELVNDANYATTADVPTKVSQLTNDKGYITAADVPAVSVPTKVSELTNDAGYITESNVTTTLNTINVSELVNDANYASTADVPTKVSQLTNDKGYITAEDVPAVSVPTKVSAFENDANYLTEHQSLAEYAKKSELPSVPTKVSELTNDANYVTEGNITTVLNTTNVSELVNDANYATTADVPTKVSQLTNDKGYITAEDVPAVTVPTKVSAFENDKNYLTEHQSLADYAKKSELPAVPTKVSQLSNDAGYITEANVTTTLNTINVSELVNDANYVTTADVPTKVSQLTNDKGYITAADVPAVSVPTKVSAFENDANYLTEHQSLADYAKKSDLPKADSLLSKAEAVATYQPKGDYLTEHQSLDAYAMKSDIPSTDGLLSASDAAATYQPKGDYLTEHQSLAEYAKKSDLPKKDSLLSKSEAATTYLTEHQSLEDYAKKSQVPTKISDLENDKEFAMKSEIPAIPTNVGDFENNVGYITKVKFDEIVDDYNSILNKYKQSLDSMCAVMEQDKKELDSMKNMMKSVAQLGLVRSVVIDKGALPGEFSVSADKKVKFSMGNLQYQASTGIWRFAENQYDYSGSQNKNIGASYSGWIDLFGWGTSGWESGAQCYQPYSSSTAQASYLKLASATDWAKTKPLADWGQNNKISNGGNEVGQWRTLTESEWDYLVNKRANASKLLTCGNIQGKNGYVLLPDGWKIPDEVVVTITTSSFSTNTWSRTDWHILEASGAVFLPCAGYRNGTTVTGVGTSAYYWTSTQVDYKYNYWVSSGGVQHKTDILRYYASSFINGKMVETSIEVGGYNNDSSSFTIKSGSGLVRSDGYSVRLVR